MEEYEWARKKLDDVISFWEDKDGVTDNDLKTYSEDLADYICGLNEFKLYKYCSAEYYSFRNLELEQVHLSPNGNQNDVYEGLPACDTNIEFEDFCSASSLALISCFSERNNSVLMWAHYADSSKGFCIEYDLTRLNREEIINLWLYPVLYKEKRIINRDLKALSKDLLTLEEDIKNEAEYSGKWDLNDLVPLMISKGMDWKYEHEWRMIRTKMDLYHQYKKSTMGFNFPLKCISGVILGYRMEKAKIEHIKEIVSRKNEKGSRISLCKAELSKDSYDFLIVSAW